MLRAPFSRIGVMRVGYSRVLVFATASHNSSHHVTESLNSDFRNGFMWIDPLLLRKRGVVRFHSTLRPLIVMGTASPSSSLYVHPSSAKQNSLLSKRCIQRRWMSSSNKNTKDPPLGDNPSTKTEQPKEPQEPGRLSSIVSSVGPTLRKVTEINVGDLVSVYAIVILIALIMFSPYVIAQMKKAESEYIELDEYDPVAQMEKIVRYDLFGEEELEKEYNKELTRERDPGHRKSVDNTIGMIADVLQSDALQEAIASLITRVLESVQFQNACQTLLKNLWSDLVNDPETTAQIVQLLNNAIQNKEIQRSTRLLVLQLIKDKEVYDELTRLLVRLGQEQEVLDATRSLLTESAHNALNDPEILDHSMEFATDVVGDDIVQRTSGEALRNTVTYAASPGLSAFLSILGIGLVWFAISAFGKSRASEQEAAMVDRAFEAATKSIQSGAREGAAAILSIPGRLLSMLASIIMFPFRLVEKGFSGLGRTGENVISAASRGIHYIFALPGAIMRAAMTKLEYAGRFISERTTDTLSRVGDSISASFIGPVLQSVATTTGSVVSSIARLTEPARHFIATGLTAVGEIISKSSATVTGGLTATGTCVNAVVSVGGRVSRNATQRLSGLCSQYGAIIQTCVISLAAKSVHAQTVTVELAKSAISHCGRSIQSCATTVTATCSSLLESLTKRSTEIEESTVKIVNGVGARLVAAGTRVSSAFTAVLSWCSKLFRRDDSGDSSTNSSTI